MSTLGLKRSCILTRAILNPTLIGGESFELGKPTGKKFLPLKFFACVIFTPISKPVAVH